MNTSSASKFPSFDVAADEVDGPGPRARLDFLMGGFLTLTLTLTVCTLIHGATLFSI